MTGLGDTRTPMYISILCNWIIGMPLAYALAFPLGFGMRGLWLGRVETPGGTSETIAVNATDAGVINTENGQISSALTPEAVLDLPANYRSPGSTSPLNLMQLLPGVQTDNASYPPAPSTHPSPSVRFSIQGGLPSQSETTVDGISAQNQTSNNIQGDAFPSGESIAEI